MLFMCVAVAALMLVIVGLAFWLYLIFFSHQLMQDSSEEVALTAAQRLNQDDQSGKINELVAHSRELVFLSRQQYNRTSEEYKAGFEPLAAQLLEESRRGAMAVSEERKNFVDTRVADMRQLLSEKTFAENCQFSLFDASSEIPHIIDFQLGTLDRMESNVAILPGVPELVANDENQHLIKHGKIMDYYRAGLAMPLPGPDADLDFQLSPVSIAVNKTTAPLRLVSAEHFRPTLTLRNNGTDRKGQCQFCPSCVQVKMSVKMRSRVSNRLEAESASVSTGCTIGSSPEPE